MAVTSPEKCDPRARIAIEDAADRKHRVAFTIYGMTVEDAEQRIRQAINGNAKSSDNEPACTG